MDENKGENGPAREHEGMGMRGVSRPMAEREMRRHQRHHQTRKGRREAPQRGEHHRQTLWIYWLVVLLGFWMVLAQLTLDDPLTLWCVGDLAG